MLIAVPLMLTAVLSSAFLLNFGWTSDHRPDPAALLGFLHRRAGGRRTMAMPRGRRARAHRR